MKKLLYLKDQELKQYIEKIFVGYRETVSDAKKILDKYSIGVAHNKVIHLISLYVFFPFGFKFVFVSCVPPQGKGKRHRRHLYCPLNSLTDQHTISNNSAN